MSGLVLVTGGAGFIGSHLVPQLLAAGRQVRVLDNLSAQVHGADARYTPLPGVEFRRGDVSVRADVEAALDGVSAIVHLAAETGTGQSMYEIDRYYRVNVQGTALIFDVLANRPSHQVRKVVLASSRSVYGEGAYACPACAPGGTRCAPAPRSAEQLARHQWEPLCPTCDGPVTAVATREADALQPASIYAATKLAQEELVRVAAGSLGLASTILRFQNVYGEGQSLANPYTGILSIFSTRIRLGLSLPIFEDGAESRDFVHVADVARAVLAGVASDAPGSVTLNVGSGEPTSIMAVAQLLARLMASREQPHVTGAYRVGDIRHNFADLAAIRQRLDWAPEIDLEQGMSRFVAWVGTQPIPQDLLDAANAELKKRNLAG